MYPESGGLASAPAPVYNYSIEEDTPTRLDTECIRVVYRKIGEKKPLSVLGMVSGLASWYWAAKSGADGPRRSTECSPA